MACIKYLVMIHLSEQVRLSELETRHFFSKESGKRIKCIFMYFDEYRTQLWLSAKKMLIKTTPSPKPYGPDFNVQYFQNIFILQGALNNRL